MHCTGVFLVYSQHVHTRVHCSCVCVCVCVCVSQEMEGLAGRLCKVLHSSPQEFGSLEVKVTESKEAVDIGHTDAAFLVLSCVDEKGSSPPPRYRDVHCTGTCILGCISAS